MFVNSASFTPSKPPSGPLFDMEHTVGPNTKATDIHTAYLHDRTAIDQPLAGVLVTMMNLLHLFNFLPVFAFAVPLITYHETISHNPIQVHKSMSSWWPWSPIYHTRTSPRDVPFTLSNVTWSQVNSDRRIPNLIQYRLPEYLDLKLKDLLMYLARQEEFSWSTISPVNARGKGHNDIVTTNGNSTAPPVLESTSGLQEAEWCWDHGLGYFEQMTRRIFKSPSTTVQEGTHIFHPGKFATFTYCMGKAEVQGLVTSSVSSIQGKRNIATHQLSGKELELRLWKKRTTDTISSGPSSPTTDMVEGHSISAFWSKLLPYHTPKEIEMFLTELCGYYKQKKAGTHSSQTRWKRDDEENETEPQANNDKALIDHTNDIPDPTSNYIFWDSYMEKYPDYFPWEEKKHHEKRDISPTSTQTLVEAGDQEGKRAKPRFKLAKGALVKNGHWDGAMRSRNLDEDADCGLMDHAYLNERCVKSNLSE